MVLPLTFTVTVPLTWSFSNSEIQNQLPCHIRLNEWRDLVRSPSAWPASAIPYLKDWHFVKVRFSRVFSRSYHKDGLGELYKWPSQFSDDWLNLFCSYRKKSSSDDFKFLYHGPKVRRSYHGGIHTLKLSRTLLHCDVLGSFSWSHNVTGKKEWTFFLPEETWCLMDSSNRPATSIHEAVTQTDRFRDFCQATPLKVCSLSFCWISCKKLIQETGQTLFVPSGWYHEVVNLEETMSINHNWSLGT